MKLKHLILFILASVILYFSDLFAGSLLVLFCLFQMCLLFYRIPLSKKSQISAFFLFLISVPLFLFYSGINSFILIYLFERQWLPFLLAITIEIMLCFAVCVQCVHLFNYLEESEFKLALAFEKTLKSIKDHRKQILKNTFILFALGFIPKIASDWKLIFSIMAIHLIQNPSLLKQAFAKPVVSNSQAD